MSILFEPPKNRITHAKQLKSGDHVYFVNVEEVGSSGKNLIKLPLYAHHALVTTVFADDNECEIIHLNEPDEEERCGCSSCLKSKDGVPTKGHMVNMQMITVGEDREMYCLDYVKDYKSSELKKRAESCLHKTEPKYNLATYNCEHFVYSITLNVAKSLQSQDGALAGLGSSLVASGAFVASSGGGYFLLSSGVSSGVCASISHSSRVNSSSFK